MKFLSLTSAQNVTSTLKAHWKNALKTERCEVMPRNGREGTHLPFAHLFLDYPSKRNIPVNWAISPDMSIFGEFGEMLETNNTQKHLHKMNQIPYPNSPRKKIEARTQVFIETIQTKKTFRIKSKETHIPLKPKRRKKHEIRDYSMETSR